MSWLGWPGHLEQQGEGCGGGAATNRQVCPLPTKPHDHTFHFSCSTKIQAWVEVGKLEGPRKSKDYTLPRSCRGWGG